MQALKTTALALAITGAGYWGYQMAQDYLFTTGPDSQQLSEEIEVQSQEREPAATDVQPIFGYKTAYDKCVTTQMPSFVNISMDWGWFYEHNAAFRGLQAISPPSVIVTGAGNTNKGVPVSPVKTKASTDFDAIIVGSISPNGFRSTFSREGQAVTIMAPADNVLTTIYDDGSYRRFGGTSGATPLVTGALAGFTWLSGYQPTGAEAKVLLKKTAIPLRLSNENPQVNGAGMVNAYKLGMVGKRLKEQCGTDINCLRLKIADEATYQFEEDTAVLELAEIAFPECSLDKCTQRRESCQDIKEVFNRLRKAFFLNPTNKEYARVLSCIYTSAGYAENAKGMVNIYNALSGGGRPERMYDEMMNPYVDKSCQVDEDCVYVPNCAFDERTNKFPPPNFEVYKGKSYLTPANRNYVSACQGPVLCDGNCRCERRTRRYFNRVLSKGSGWKTLTPRCVNSQCVEEEIDPDQTEESSTSGQR